MMPLLKQIELTPSAAERVKDFMKKESKSEAVLRLYVAGGGCSGMTYGLALEDATSEEDIVMEQHGVKVVVDPFSLNYLRGSKVDYVETLQGSGFKIDNPNVTHSCSCGHSFQTG